MEEYGTSHQSDKGREGALGGGGGRGGKAERSKPTGAGVTKRFLSSQNTQT